MQDVLLTGAINHLEALGLLKLLGTQQHELVLIIETETMDTVPLGVLLLAENGVEDGSIEVRIQAGVVLLDWQLHAADRNTLLVHRNLRDDTLEELEHVLRSEERDVELDEGVGLRELLRQLIRFDEPLGVVRIANTVGHEEDLLEERDQFALVLRRDELLPIGFEALAGPHLQVEELRLGQVEPEVLGDFVAVVVFVGDGLLEQGIAFLQK